jgi:hypothetical protein
VAADGGEASGGGGGSSPAAQAALTATAAALQAAAEEAATGVVSARVLLIPLQATPLEWVRALVRALAEQCRLPPPPSELAHSTAAAAAAAAPPAPSTVTLPALHLPALAPALLVGARALRAIRALTGGAGGAGAAAGADDDVAAWRRVVGSGLDEELTGWLRPLRAHSPSSAGGGGGGGGGDSGDGGGGLVPSNVEIDSAQLDEVELYLAAMEQAALRLCPAMEGLSMDTLLALQQQQHTQPQQGRQQPGQQQEGGGTEAALTDAAKVNEPEILQVNLVWCIARQFIAAVHSGSS